MTAVLSETARRAAYAERQAARLVTAICDDCGSERPALEFEPGYTQGLKDGVRLCGVCRASHVLLRSPYLYNGAANSAYATLRAATNIPVDDFGTPVRDWLSDYYGIDAGWLHMLEHDAGQTLTGRSRVQFVVEHLCHCLTPVEGGHLAHKDALKWREER